ncbi:MAG: autoinducer binding domain-containing protein [Burkholderiales bacterium]
MLLQDHCDAVSDALTRDEFQRALVRFAQELGFAMVSASAVYDRPGADAEFVTAHNAPESYLPIFLSGCGAFDPVMQHCKHSGLPIVWDQATYVRAGRGEQWEVQAAHGLRTGISMALHLPHGTHFVFGVDGDGPLPKQQHELSRMVTDLVSVMMYAQDNALRLLPLQSGLLSGEHQKTNAFEWLSFPWTDLPS